MSSFRSYSGPHQPALLHSMRCLYCRRWRILSSHRQGIRLRLMEQIEWADADCLLTLTDEAPRSDPPLVGHDIHTGLDIPVASFGEDCDALGVILGRID